MYGMERKLFVTAKNPLRSKYCHVHLSSKSGRIVCHLIRINIAIKSSLTSDVDMNAPDKCLEGFETDTCWLQINIKF